MSGWRLPDDLDLAARQLEGRRLRAAALAAAALTTLRAASLWSIATPRHKGAAVLMTALLLALAAGGRRLEPAFERFARGRTSVALALLGWAVVGPIGYGSLQLAHLAYVAVPFTAVWLLARGWSVFPVLALSWAAVALLLHKVALAPLPAAALLLRRRPALAFGAILGLGALLRVGLSVAVPRPLWVPDSSTYVELAHRLLLDQELGTNLPRPPHVAGLVLVSLALGRSYFWYVAAAHAIGWASAWWVSDELRRRLGDLAGWQACAALALSPELLYYEHTLLSEALFVANLSVLVALLLELRPGATPTLVRVVALGLAAGVLASQRPVALLAPVLVLGAAAAVRWSWVRLGTLAAASAAPLLLLCAFNLAVNGFFGASSPQFSSYVWFSVTGHQLALDTPLHAEIKREMRPAIERHNAARPPWDPFINFLVWAPDGPLNTSPTLQALPPEARGRVIQALATEAIRRDPETFLRRVGYQVVVRYLFAPPGENDCYFPSWDLIVDHERWVAVPPALRERLAPPAPLGALEGPRAFAVVAPLLDGLGGGVGTPLYGTQLFAAYKAPLVAIPLLLLILTVPRLRPWRPAALCATGVAAMIVGITCVVQEPLPRYRLQTYPVGVLLVAVALARPAPARGAG